MQQQLDDAHAEIAALSSSNRAVVASGGGDGSHHAVGDACKQASSGTSTSALRAPATRALRSAAARSGAAGGEDNNGHGASATEHHHSSSSSSSSSTTFGSLSYSGYLEQSEYAEKRIEQLTRETREMLSKGLEEIKEKNEVAQKLLLMEKENTALKAELRKNMLERERSERKFSKQLEEASAKAAHAMANKENMVN